jgi:thiol-disulfide isomerase/thioredoxin
MTKPHLPRRLPRHPAGPAGARNDARGSRRAVCALLGAGALLLAGPAGATPEEVTVGGILRDAALQGLNGPSRRLSQFRGRALLINVWASWCGPCIEEMASIERLAWMEGRPPFAVIGVSTDDYPEAARAYLRRSNATISHYIDHALQIENMLGAAKIPLTVLVGPEGRVLDKIYGARDWDSPASLQRIAQAFGGARSTPL